MLDRIVSLMSYQTMQLSLAACLMCGIGCALVSVFVVLQRMPIIAVTMSHAAFAGAVIGLLIGVPPFLSSVVACVMASMIIGPISEKSGMSPENAMGILFSFLTGIAFLGLGILSRTKAEAFGLLWGGLLSLNSFDFAVILIATCLVILFFLLFYKEIKAVLFNRMAAAANGVPARAIYYGILMITGLVVSANLSTVGGVLIFALIAQPAATAYQLANRFGAFVGISVCAGVVSCAGGLVVSYLFDWPSGASVALVSTMLFAVAFVISPKRKDRRVSFRN